MVNLILLIDIDECAKRQDNCVQTCTNTNGSYVCFCEAGYRLASDGYSCNGEYYNYGGELDFFMLLSTLCSKILMNVLKAVLAVRSRVLTCLAAICVHVVWVII